MSQAFNSLKNFEIWDGLSWVFKEYFPYGSFFMLLGIAISAMMYGKTKSMGITASIFGFYTAIAVISNLIPLAVQPYYMLLIGILTTVLLIRVFYK